MNRFTQSILGGFLGAAAFTIVLWLFAAPQIVQYANAHPNLAGWAQAVGAFLALGCLFLAQRLDHGHAQKLRLEDAEEKRRHAARASITAAKFLTAAVAAAVRLKDKTAVDQWTVGQVALLKTDVAAAIAIMKEIDRGGLPSEPAVVAVVNLLQAGHATDVLLGHIAMQIEAGKSAGDPPFPAIQDGAEKSLTQLTDAWKATGLTTL